MRAGRRSMGRSFYGYKNHVNADGMQKLIRRYDVSDASSPRQPEARMGF